MALPIPRIGHKERKLSGSFMLTNELTRQELSEQIVRVRSDVQREESTTPYVASTDGASENKMDYDKTLARLDFYYLMGM